jgi:hypothetical protein
MAGTGARQGASAGQPVTSPTPTASPQPLPAPKALTDAMAIADAAARLEALEKVRVDFPNVPNPAAVDNQILGTLVNNFPERLDAITATFDRMIERIPVTATVDARVNGLAGPIGVPTGKKLLLDNPNAAHGRDRGARPCEIRGNDAGCR